MNEDAKPLDLTAALKEARARVAHLVALERETAKPQTNLERIKAMFAKRPWTYDDLFVLHECVPAVIAEVEDLRDDLKEALQLGRACADAIAGDIEVAEQGLSEPVSLAASGAMGGWFARFPKEENP